MAPDDARNDGDAKKVQTIRFKDAVGRKFSFPFEIVKTWPGMEDLIKQAFLHVDVIGPHVQEGHYDLIGPEGDIILPQTWKYFIQPDWTIEMRMWPMDKPQPPPRPRGPQPPRAPRPPPGAAAHPPGIPPPPGLAPSSWPTPSWDKYTVGGPSRMTDPTQLYSAPPPPPGWQAPEIINVTKPQRPKKTARPGGQGSVLSWMAGKSKKKQDSVSGHSDDEAPPAPPAPAGPPDVPDITAGRDTHRSTLAKEMVPNVSAPRNVGDRSFNLRPKKKKHAKRRAAPSSSSSSSSSSMSSTAASGSSTTSSDRMSSSTRTMNEEDARRLISERRLIVTCTVSSRPLRRPTTALDAAKAKTINTPPDVLELSAAQIHRDGFEKMAFATLELVKQRAMRSPPNNERSQTGHGTMTWKHVTRPVMNLQEFEDMSRHDFGADNATRSAVDQLFVCIRKKMLDEYWFIKPGTVLRCDTRPGEEAPASVMFVSVPYMYADSFKSTLGKYQGSENCLPRRLHEAFGRLGSVEEDKRQHFRQNEGRGTGQVLWIGQAWILLGASSLLTYGMVSREVLEGDTIAIRDRQLSNEIEDRVVRIMDEERRLFYLPADKCRSFYELETSARDKMSTSEQDLTQCDFTFYLPNDEVLNASKWSSLLKLEDLPIIKVSINSYSGDESDEKASAGAASIKSAKSSNSSDSQEEKAKSDISLELDLGATGPIGSGDDLLPERGEQDSRSWNRSRQKFVHFNLAEEVASNLPDDVPQLNGKVPPFFDWKPSKTGAGTSLTPADSFRERLDEVEADLLQLYKYHHSKTNAAIRQAYDAFGNNVYEEAVQRSFGDFSHTRRSKSKDAGGPAGSGPDTSRARLSSLSEDFFNVSIPALEAFVLSEFKSSLTMKYFGSLSKILVDPTSSELLRHPDDPTKPHRFISTEDELRQRWVVSRDLIKQAGLRFVLSQTGDETQCPDCERGTIYHSPDKGVSHLRKMHLATSKSDRVLRDYLVPLPAALIERLDEEVSELLVAGRNILASTLRKLVAIQSGVIDNEEFRGSERGIPYYLVDAFKLIVVLVCALPEALHELRWFYYDFDHNAQSMTSQKAQSQRSAMEKLGELAGDLIRKAERTLVSPTGTAKESNAEHFMTSVGLNYLSLQIMLNLMQRPIHNRKKLSDLYTAYARDLGSDVQRKPSKRQIPRIGALTSELNLLKDVIELQKDYIDSFNALSLPGTLHQSLARETDRHKLFWIESDLLSELGRAARREDESLDGVLELCVQLKGLVSELTEIMADDQGRAVFVFTVVTVTFLPLSFVASYLSMSGGTDGLGMEWGEVQARFWAVAGPLTAVVAGFCFFIAGRGTVARLLSRPTQRAAAEEDADDEWASEAPTTTTSTLASRRGRRGRRRWRWPWSITIRRRGDSSSSDRSSDYSSDELVRDD